jgi:hypothetical protein
MGPFDHVTASALSEAERDAEVARIAKSVHKNLMLFWLFRFMDVKLENNFDNLCITHKICALSLTALSFKISHTIPKYPYFIGDIPPICPRKS